MRANHIHCFICGPPSDKHGCPLKLRPRMLVQCCTDSCLQHNAAYLLLLSAARFDKACCIVEFLRFQEKFSAGKRYTDHQGLGLAGGKRMKNRKLGCRASNDFPYIDGKVCSKMAISSPSPILQRGRCSQQIRISATRVEGDRPRTFRFADA